MTSQKSIATLAGLITLAVATVAGAQQCQVVDPGRFLNSVVGDFELTTDPGTGGVIYVSNVAKVGPTNVVVARVDGMTGIVEQTAPSVIASNFTGDSSNNGPEFVLRPTGSLGILYAGAGGVHGAFRPPSPSAWNDFNTDVTGGSTFGSPPVLSSTSSGNYPAYQVEGGETYAQSRGACLRTLCAGSLAQGVYTDLGAKATAQGIAASAAALSMRDEYVFLGGCDAAGCGIYEGKIDGAGGLVITKVASTAVKPSDVTATRHPLTGATVVFTAGPSRIDVWQQPAIGGALTTVGSVTASMSSPAHFRATPDTTRSVLHYYSPNGSYTLAVSSVDGALSVGAPKNISPKTSGAELVWLTPAAQWALFYRQNNSMTRCWVSP